MRNRLILSSLLTLMLIVSSGCGLTLGPVAEKTAVIVRPGKPLIVTKNVTVEGTQLETNEPVKQDIGGWVIMPKEHWDVIKARLEK